MCSSVLGFISSHVYRRGCILMNIFPCCAGVAALPTIKSARYQAVYRPRSLMVEHWGAISKIWGQFL